ncbi:hypothetical protein STEG23_016079 [Scotinomys teguina]
MYSSSNNKVILVEQTLYVSPVLKCKLIEIEQNRNFGSLIVHTTCQELSSQFLLALLNDAAPVVVTFTPLNSLPSLGCGTAVSNIFDSVNLYFDSSIVVFMTFDQLHRKSVLYFPFDISMWLWKGSLLYTLKAFCKNGSHALPEYLPISAPLSAATCSAAYR